jgi:hypothetical protein
VFDRFSISGRRVVFWARKEAGSAGAEAIGPEHLLLGLLIEDQDDSRERFAEFAGAGRRVAIRAGAPVVPFFGPDTVKKLRAAVVESARPVEPIPDSADMSLSDPAKAVLKQLVESGDGQMIELLDVLRALLSDGGRFLSDLLASNGVTLEQVDAGIRERHQR